MSRSRICTITRQVAARQIQHTSLFRIPLQFTSRIHHSSRAQSVTTSVTRLPAVRTFQTSSTCRAQAPTADALMENLNDLYATAKDEFEIAAEETEKKTVYAADDREAAKEAFGLLKEAYERAIRESGPEVAKEVQTRTGPRIKELENALTAVEEMAMED